METIKEAAMTAATKAGYRPKIASDEIGRTVYECGFKKGVEFAQQWISVKEELPNQYKKVLVKIALLNCTKENEFDFSVAMIAHTGDWDVFFGKDRPITHWREIELK